MMNAIWRSKRPEMFQDQDQIEDQDEQDQEQNKNNSTIKLQQNIETENNGSNDTEASFQMMIESQAGQNSNLNSRNASEQEANQQQIKRNRSSSQSSNNQEEKNMQDSNIAVMLRNDGKQIKAKEILAMDFDYSVEHFYKTFITDDAKFGLQVYNTIRGDKNMELQPWKQIEGGQLTRTYKAVIKLMNKSQNWLIIYSYSKTPDLPYADSFIVEDKWEIKNKSPQDGIGCHLSISQWVTFFKSTVFKNKIQSRSNSDMKKDVQNWCQEMKKKKLHLAPAAPQDSQKAGISHQLEQAQNIKLMERNDQEGEENKEVDKQVHPFLALLKKNWKSITIVVLVMIVINLIQIVWRMYFKIWELQSRFKHM